MSGHSELPPIEGVLGALADPTRRHLLDRIAMFDEATATVLAADMSITRQAVVQHLAVLEAAGLVEGRRVGRERLFVVCPQRLIETARWMDRIAAQWGSRLGRIKSLAERIQQGETAQPGKRPDPKIHGGNKIMETQTISKEILIKATPERIFKALTEKSELESWFVYQAEIELKPGGAFRVDFVPGMGEHGRVIELKPSQAFSFTWEALAPTPTTIAFALAPERDGTLVTLTHSGIGEGEKWSVYATIGTAWDSHLKDLTSWVETGTCPKPGPRG